MTEFPAISCAEIARMNIACHPSGLLDRGIPVFDRGPSLIQPGIPDKFKNGLPHEQGKFALQCAGAHTCKASESVQTVILRRLGKDIVTHAADCLPVDADQARNRAWMTWFEGTRQKFQCAALDPQPDDRIERRRSGNSIGKRKQMRGYHQWRDLRSTQACIHALCQFVVENAFGACIHEKTCNCLAGTLPARKEEFASHIENNAAAFRDRMTGFPREPVFVRVRGDQSDRKRATKNAPTLVVAMRVQPGETGTDAGGKVERRQAA